MSEVYARLPGDWRVFLEHKLNEPAFYSTVISDWGTSLMAAQALGPKAHCLVDLGHHAPNVNIEQIVSRLIRAGRLAGFHFNDSKYGDDDLDTGSIDPFRLFRVFNELVDASARGAAGFDPAYMLDQSHNVTDPIESLMVSAMETQRAYAQALVVDREALAGAQDANDVMLAHRILKAGLRYRRFADPGGGADAQWRSDRSDRGLSGFELSQGQGEGAPCGHRFVIGDCLKRDPPRAQTAPCRAASLQRYRDFRSISQRRKRRRGSGKRAPRLFRRRRRHPLDGDGRRLGLAPEAPPGHADVAEQSDPGIRGAEVRRELPVGLQRDPIGVAPSLEHRMEFVGLLGPYR